MAVHELSRREQEVLTLIAKGLTNNEIAQSLHISPQSTKNVVTRLLLKRNARNRTELALITKSPEYRREEICRFTGQPCGGSDCRLWSEKFQTCLLVEMLETAVR